MKHEEPGAPMQGPGARPRGAWPGGPWPSGVPSGVPGRLPAGRAAYPHLQGHHHLLLGLRHVVHPGRLRHRVRGHHLDAGALRRVRGGVRHAAALQEPDIQPHQRRGVQQPGLPRPRLALPGHVHRSCECGA